MGLRPRPHWGSLQRSPRPIAGFKERLRGRREWRERLGGGGREGKRGNGKGRERGELGNSASVVEGTDAPGYTLTPPSLSKISVIAVHEVIKATGSCMAACESDII